MRRLKQLGKQMAQTPDEQISLTDPDARSMATSARGSGTVGYNVQTAVDAKHHLVVTHEVTKGGTDRAQLASMGQQTQEALGTDKLTALADRGYYAGPEILKCEQAGINVLVWPVANLPEAKQVFRKFVPSPTMRPMRIEMGRQVAISFCVVAMVAVIVSLDVAFFRSRFWERLMANIGVVFVFAAFYFRFLGRP